MLYTTTFSPRDINFVIPRLRAMDRFEALSRFPSVERGMQFSIAQSMWLFTIRCGSLPVGIGGVSKLAEGEFCPWLVGTDVLTYRAVEFLRGSREVWDTVLQVTGAEDGTVFWNAVHEDNTLHRRWLEWLGFEPVQERVPVLGGPRFKEYRYVLGRSPCGYGRAQPRRNRGVDGCHGSAVRCSVPASEG